MTEIKKGTMGESYHLKSLDLDRIVKHILANDHKALLQLDTVDFQISMACNFMSLLKTVAFEIEVLDRIISNGQEYPDSDVEFKVRHSLLKVAAELDESSIGNLLPLFKSFDLTSDISYFIKTEQVRKAVEKVFLEILIIKGRTYNQAKADYLSEHPYCKLYPIEPDGINGVTIDNFWPEKHTNSPKQSELEKPETTWRDTRLQDIPIIAVMISLPSCGVSLYVDSSNGVNFFATVAIAGILYIGVIKPVWFD